MEGLLRCRLCRHCATKHNGSGCAECGCTDTLETVIEDGLEAARFEIRNLWTPSSGHQSQA
jgi:hypothetical protein